MTRISVTVTVLAATAESLWKMQAKVNICFLSDIHIRNMKESNSQKLLLFLYALNHQPVTHLFLVGDIFDLWIHKHKYFVAKFFKIVNAINTLVKKGVEVHYFEGNHDFHLKQFWQQEVGVKVHDGPAFFSIGHYKLRVEHGDFMNPDDRAYFLLRSFLRSKPINFMIKNTPGSLIQWIGGKASAISRYYSSNPKKLNEEIIRDFMHNYAGKVIREGFFDYLITGHTHVRDIYEFNEKGKKVYSINLGCWLKEQKVLVLDESGHRFQNIDSHEFKFS